MQLTCAHGAEMPANIYIYIYAGHEISRCMGDNFGHEIVFVPRLAKVHMHEVGVSYRGTYIKALGVRMREVEGDKPSPAECIRWLATQRKWRQRVRESDRKRQRINEGVVTNLSREERLPRFWQCHNGEESPGLTHVHMRETLCVFIFLVMYDQVLYTVYAVQLALLLAPAMHGVKEL